MSATHAPPAWPERPRELQDWQNFYLYHPLARRIALALRRTPVTPNMVSVAGGFMVVLAAAAYSLQAGVASVMAGLVLHMGWHVLDGADGDLARLTGRSSTRGEIVDGFCDYLSHIVLYIVLAMMLSDQVGPVAWLLMLAAGIGRILQTIHFETQRRQYQWWVYGTSWLRTVQAKDKGDDDDVGSLGTGYLALSGWLTPNGERVDRLIAREARPTELCALIRREEQPVLRGLPLLGSNYRTLALGVSMLAGSALYYFVYEATFLVLVLMLSIKRSRAATARILAHAPASTSR